MKAVALNFRDSRIEPAPQTDEEVLTVGRYGFGSRGDELYVSVEESEDAYDCFWIPVSEIGAALYGKEEPACTTDIAS